MSRMIWGVLLNKGNAPIHLKPGQCLGLGQPLPGYTPYAGPVDLHEDTPYAFSIHAQDYGRYETRSRTVYFCLRKSPSGLQVRNIPLSSQAFTAETCRRLFEQSS